jgi:hypothetical protein
MPGVTSALMLTARITLAHFSVSSATRARDPSVDRPHKMGLSRMPADGISMPAKKGLPHVPLGRLEA